MEDIFRFLMEDAPKIAQACLAILGGLKIIAYYTPWQGDDKLIEKLEAPVKFVASKLMKKKE